MGAALSITCMNKLYGSGHGACTTKPYRTEHVKTDPLGSILRVDSTDLSWGSTGRKKNEETGQASIQIKNPKVNVLRPTIHRCVRL